MSSSYIKDEIWKWLVADLILLVVAIVLLIIFKTYNVFIPIIVVCISQFFAIMTLYAIADESTAGVGICKFLEVAINIVLCIVLGMYIASD